MYVYFQTDGQADQTVRQMPFPTAAVVPSTSSWQQGGPHSGSDFPLPELGIDFPAKPEPPGLNPATGKCELYDKAWHDQSDGNVSEHISLDRIIGAV